MKVIVELFFIEEVDELSTVKLDGIDKEYGIVYGRDNGRRRRLGKRT
jgi:hypothetical protein